jgi:hypothetical protein
VASFSKAIVLDIYSGFINNFSVAMDLAKMESKRKSAFADFLKVRYKGMITHTVLMSLTVTMCLLNFTFIQTCNALWLLLRFLLLVIRYCFVSDCR